MKLRYKPSYYIEHFIGILIIVVPIMLISMGMYACYDSVEKTNKMWNERQK